MGGGGGGGGGGGVQIMIELSEKRIVPRLLGEVNVFGQTECHSPRLLTKINL